jgi:protein-disulfide isomerase
MPSQKASKRRRQEPRTPPPPVRRTGGSRRASPKVLIAAGAIVLLIIVGVVLGVVLLGGSDSSSGTASKLPDAADVQQAFAGIPQNGNVLGDPKAPVTVITYVDLQCPFCRQFETEAMPTILENYVRPGKAKVEARVISFIGPDSQRGREAALAAAQQNKMFNFMQLLYDNQGPENTGWLSDDFIKSATASIPGLDAGQLQTDKGSGAVKDKLDTIDSQSEKAGVNSTPTIYVVGKDGKPKLVTLTSPGDPSALETAIKNAAA